MQKTWAKNFFRTGVLNGWPNVRKGKVMNVERIENLWQELNRETGVGNCLSSFD